MFIPRLLTVLCSAIPLAPLSAHEFWIEPEAYQVSLGAAIRADFKNGQNFVGTTLSYLDRNAARHEMAMDGAVQPIIGRAGDKPAIQVPKVERGGLLVLVHETTPTTLTYREWEKFLKFAAHKDFTTAAADHAAAGWSTEKFREAYTRHVKALVAVGDGAGKDRVFGMATEFVALSNPYDAAFDGTMRVALMYQGTPRPDAQVEVFDRAPNDVVTVTLHRTDAEGEAAIAVTPGHTYLFDAVVLRAAPDPGDDPKAPVWESLWAALTFAVPEN